MNMSFMAASIGIISQVMPFGVIVQVILHIIIAIGIIGMGIMGMGIIPFIIPEGICIIGICIIGIIALLLARTTESFRISPN